MLKTTLQFKSLFALWSFKVKVRAQNVVVHAKKNLLICELSENDVKVARVCFAAKVIL